MNQLETYLNSSFYKKYQATYHSDRILKYVFSQQIYIHKYKSSSLSYHDVYLLNLKVLNDFYYLYYKENNIDNEKMAKLMIHSFYIDPDSKAIKNYNDIECTADALISINRIMYHQGISENMLIDYRKYIESPILYFPRESGGINTTRYVVFGDRIDHALFDIKCYFDNIGASNVPKCKMMNAYNLPKTHTWLTEIGSFHHFISIYNLSGSFVNDHDDIFDIEKGNHSTICDFQGKYSHLWSDGYYLHLKDILSNFL